MLLVFDISNTQITVGVFREKRVADWVIRTDMQKTADEYGILVKSLFEETHLEPDPVEGAMISSVVPPLTGVIVKMVRKYFGVQPMIVGAGIKTGLAIKFENPREIGADKIADAVAAIAMYGAPLIIIDFGTATTFSAISPDGDFLGGSIAPGLCIVSRSLMEYTARLPGVELIRPKQVIGKNTIHSIQSGLYYGYIGLVESIIGRMKLEMRAEPKVIATGGAAELVATDIGEIDRVDPYLTLEGLRMIYRMNHA